MLIFCQVSDSNLFLVATYRTRTDKKQIHINAHKL